MFHHEEIIKPRRIQSPLFLLRHGRLPSFHHHNLHIENIMATFIEERGLTKIKVFTALWFSGIVRIDTELSMALLSVFLKVHNAALSGQLVLHHVDSLLRRFHVQPLSLMVHRP